MTTDLAQTQTCYECGAIIHSGYSGKHQDFHRQVERVIKEIEQVKRLSR